MPAIKNMNTGAMENINDDLHASESKAITPPISPKINPQTMGKRKYKENNGDGNESDDNEFNSTFFSSTNRRQAQLMLINAQKEGHEKMINFRDKFLAFFNDTMNWRVEEYNRLELDKQCFSFHFRVDSLHANAFEHIFAQIELDGFQFEQQSTCSSCSKGTFTVYLTPHSLDLDYIDTYQEQLKLELTQAFHHEQRRMAMRVNQQNQASYFQTQQLDINQQLHNEAKQFSIGLAIYLNQREFCHMKLASALKNGKLYFKFNMLETDFDFYDDMSELGRHRGWTCVKEETESGRSVRVLFESPFLNKSANEHLNDLITYYDRTYPDQNRDENNDQYENGIKAMFK